MCGAGEPTVAPMADIADARRLVLLLPETIAERNGARGGQEAFGVAGKAFAWTWMERIYPRQPRVPNPGVLAIRVASLAEGLEHSGMGVDAAAWR